jgi:hypothetical protein
LNIHLLPLPGYSPNLMEVEPLWRWLRDAVTYHHCHATAADVIRHGTACKVDVNADPGSSPTSSSARGCDAPA